MCLLRMTQGLRMTEQTGSNISMMLLVTVTAYCLLAFINEIEKSGLSETASVYMFVNHAVFWKLYLGAKRYYLMIEKGSVHQGGWQYLYFAFFRFY
jgi:hypothetical protein